MVLEGSAWRGLDNVFIPIGGFFLLRAYLELDAAALALRLAVIAGLAALVLVRRTQTTLEDSALLAGVLIGYVTWAIAGWRWLVPPAIVFVAYTWLSPPTAENSRRVHAPYAILSVCGPGLAWLAAFNWSGRADLYYPYTLAFASQLALIGIARIAFERPQRPLPAIVLLCVARGSLLLLPPFVLLTGGTMRALLLAVAGVGGVLSAAVAFAALEPDVRHCRLDGPRWLRQAGCAALGSLVELGWLAWWPA